MMCQVCWIVTMEWIYGIVCMFHDLKTFFFIYQSFSVFYSDLILEEKILLNFEEGL